MNNIRQTVIDNKLYNVVPYEEYCSHPEINNNYSTAVQMKVGSEEKVLPIRSPLDNQPGLYNKTWYDEIIVPVDDDQYNTDHVIDLSNSDNIEDLMRKQDQVRNIEKEILTSPGDITVPNISSLDSPEMRAVKEAIIAKHIDINKYSERFGSNFANDKRILKTNAITQKMMKRILSNIDVKATLILEDTSSNVANPMGKKIEIVITDDLEDEEWEVINNG